MSCNPSESDLILVTGASGFLATHVVKQLIELGYRVRGTVRSLNNPKKVEPLKNLVKNPTHELELVEADLCNEQSWLAAVKDCTHVIHTASPVPGHVPSDEMEVIKPAVDGTNNVLKACMQPGSLVKRVVLTSSLAAIAGDEYEHDKLYSEKDFSSTLNAQPYTKSKILAEKAAWDFVKENNNCFELAVINPGFIVGPVLHDTFAASMEPAKLLMERSVPILADVYFPGCDVRMVAKSHIAAMKSKDAVSKRFICLGDSKSYQFKEYALWLKEEFESMGYNIPTTVAPNWLFQIAKYFDTRAKFLCPLLSKQPKFDISELVNTLKIEPMSTKQAFIDQAYSMVDRGFIKKTDKYSCRS